MDLKRIEELITLLEGSRSEEMCVTKGDFTVRVRKGGKLKPAKPKQPAGSAKAPAAAQEQPPDEQYILAPMVGIFHTVDGVAQIGAKISKGQVVGAIESMKLLNDVVSDLSGTVSEVLVDEGTPVEFGQVLCRIEPE